MGTDMREVYADTLLELAKENDAICVLEADLMNATGTKVFKERFPERFYDFGVAEANMVGIASGLSAEGMIPFAATFGTFASRRVFDQFFLSANYAQLNVKLVGTDPGVTAQFNGGTHMPFEDVGMMRLIPNLVIIEPCDTVSCRALITEAATYHGSVYLRLQRKGGMTIYDEHEHFEIGKGKVLQDGSDITLIASGFVMVQEALKAAETLKSQGISAAVLDIHTIKPLDNDLIIRYAKRTGAILTCENHQIAGGLGGAVAEMLSENYPTPLSRIGSQDRFGQVGTMEFLMEDYGLAYPHIVEKAQKLIAKKGEK